ncbi:hypothetical protein L2E82_44781 [Cichorium intybus]|uniref:Uncharacterized protein n=1 Tax=Cichorium intybus TaxID=13427 RepID=A0ACB8ZQ71_CICIN|nr:hypothetical protein L2E82_44781 [Cichorium intybus]
MGSVCRKKRSLSAKQMQSKESKNDNVKRVMIFDRRRHRLRWKLMASGEQMASPIKMRSVARMNRRTVVFAGSERKDFSWRRKVTGKKE